MAIIQPTAEQRAAAANPTPLNVGIPGDGVYITDPIGGGLLIKQGNTLYQTGIQALGDLVLKSQNDPRYQQNGALSQEKGREYLSSLGIDYNSLPQMSGGAVADLLGYTQRGQTGLTFSNAPIDLNNFASYYKSATTSGGAPSSVTLNTQPALPASPEAIAAATAEQTKQLSGYSGMNVVQSTTPEGIPGVTKTPLGTPAATTPTTPVAAATPTTPAAGEPNDITQLLTLPDLQEGSQGQEVLTLQNWLVAHGFLSGADMQTGPGTYGPKTQAAVAAWQAASGIDTAGNPGYFGQRSKAYLQQQIQSGATTAAPGTTGQPGAGMGTQGAGDGTGSSGGGDMSGSMGSDFGTGDLTDITNQIRRMYGLPEAKPGQTLVQQAISDYSAIYDSLGITSIKKSYEDAQKSFGDIQNELADKTADINEDPWLSEGTRVARIARLQERYATKLDIATGQMNLYKSMIDDGMSQANAIMGDLHNLQSSAQDAVNQAINIVQKQQDAALKLATATKDTQVVEVNGHKYLIDGQTGAKIADLGMAPAGSGSGGLSANQISSTVNQIAQSFDNEPIVKNYNVLSEAKQFVDSLSNTTQNASDDQGLIYAFAKAMDPNSVVREGEYATVQKYAQSWANQFGGSFNQALNGTGFLSTDARKSIKSTINTKYQASLANYNNVYSQYQQRIQQASSGNLNSLTNYASGYPTAPQNNGFNINAGSIVESGGQKYIIASDGETVLPLSGFKPIGSSL